MNTGMTKFQILISICYVVVKMLQFNNFDPFTLL